MEHDPFDLNDLDAPPVAPPETRTDYLTALNPEQRAAVETTEGPVLVLSGAGTGKTRVLTTRLGHILTLGLARPGEVLAVTFTNKAAREMRERVATLVGPVAEGLWLGTFHALGARLLRRHAEAVGLTSTFLILDDDDQIRLLKQVADAEGLRDDKRHPPRMLLTLIQRWKDRGLAPDQITDEERTWADGVPARLYPLYQDRLRTLNAVDFGDLLLLTLTLFRQNPDILERYQQRFRYLLVDEYQDTNVAQYLWLRLLAQGHRNLCCVGDDDQSIYSWRGAEVGNILRFEEDFPGATVIRLERNYRSTAPILAAASGLIARNQDRLGKTLYPAEDGPGHKVAVISVRDSEEEARAVCARVQRLAEQGVPLEEMAVLVRAGFQTREFEERLIRLGLPYQVLGGPRFYERQEIRDALAYLRLTVTPSDDLAFERILNVPRRGLGDTTLKRLHQTARAHGWSLTETTRRLVETDELRAAQRKGLRQFVEMFDRWRDLLDAMPHSELVGTLLDESGYTDMWQARKQERQPDAQTRLDNLRELVGAVAEFDSLPAFLEHVSLVMEATTAAPAGRLSLMTLHGAKGLEFDVVFLPGWEEGLFPHQRALDEGGAAALEEERRLAYVGLTRARRRAFVLHAAARRIYNQVQPALPSRFLGELPADQVVRQLADGAPQPVPAADPDPAVPPAPGPPFRDSGDEVFRVGDRVAHARFGQGRVMEVSGHKVGVLFADGQHKQVIDSFLTMVIDE